MRPSRGNRLVTDYVAGSPAAAPFYVGHWADPDAYAAKAREVDARFDRATRERAAAAVHAPTGESRARLERWVEDGGFFVTGGQQPGLFTGPLYTLYKALTACRLASELERRLSRPVLPLFWVASEDHDWDEVDHAWLLDRANELRRIQVPIPAGSRGRPLHRIVPGEPLEQAVGSLEECLPPSDFSARYLQLLREAYHAHATLPGAFRRTMEELLAPYGLLFTDAADPVVKAASVAVLGRELDEAEAHEGLLRGTAAALERAGYDVQVLLLEGGVNLFVEGPAGRERLYRANGELRLRHSGEALTRADLRDLLGSDPSRVSPNVLLRPVVESAVFPVLSLIAGPGEIAYLAQLKDLFEAHGLGAPVVFPRFSVTAVEAKNRKVLDKFGLEPESLEQPHHELAAEIARDEVPPEVRRALGEIRGSIGQGSARLLELAREIDPTLKGPLTTARNAALAAFQEADKKIVQAVKRENEIALSQLEKAQLHLHPQGKPQERVLNAFYYLFRYGDAFLEAVSERCAVRLESRGAPTL